MKLLGRHCVEVMFFIKMFLRCHGSVAEELCFNWPSVISKLEDLIPDLRSRCQSRLLNLVLTQYVCVCVHVCVGGCVHCTYYIIWFLTGGEGVFSVHCMWLPWTSPTRC